MKYDCRVVISWLLVKAAVVFIFYDQFEEREVLTSTNFKSNFKIVDKFGSGLIVKQITSINLIIL